MKTEEYNPGISLRVPDATCEHLCRAVAAVPGVVITRKLHSIWSTAAAEFTFRGHTFLIEPDEWDGVLWILSKNFQKHEAEMQELRDAVERFTRPTLFQRFFHRVVHDHDA